MECTERAGELRSEPPWSENLPTKILGPKMEAMVGNQKKKGQKNRGIEPPTWGGKKGKQTRQNELFANVGGKLFGYV